LPDIRPFHSKDAQTLTVDLGQSLQIPCPAHGTSSGAVYSWYGTVTVEFKRNARRAILPTGDMFIMYVTEEDISKTEELKGIKCTMTGANTIYRSGPITLKKGRPGNNLLYYILYCITVGCCGIRHEPDSGTNVQVQALAEVFMFHLRSWEYSKCSGIYSHHFIFIDNTARYSTIMMCPT